MKRYPGLDIMRGLAIFMMVVFHVIMRWYDRGWLEDGELGGTPLIFLVLLLVVIFFSGWAAFFLLVSSISNMISMQKAMERGISWKRLMLFQVGGGFLLLIAAILVESTIGYHGYLGEAVKGNFDRWPIILYRGYHMETIHTIALCIVINGIVHSLLVRKGGINKPARNMRIYGLLAFSILILTGPVYWILKRVYSGYPVSMRSSEIVGKSIEVQYAVIGESSIGEILLKALFVPLGGLPEPLFPFLAVSFIGSMIGIHLTKRTKSLSFVRKGITAGLILFLTGLMGTVSVLVLGFYDFGDFTEYFYQLPGLYPGAWLWWFLCLTGAQLATVMLFLRMVEYRGKGDQFGRRTLFLRRYGFVAFSIYTFQFIDVIPRAVFQLFPDLASMYPYPKELSALLCIAMIPMTVLVWEIVLRLWEKVDFVFGMEWWIAKAAERLFPGKRVGSRDDLKWYQVKRLDPIGYLRKPEWLNARKVNHEIGEDSRLSFSLCLAGIIFYPLSLIGGIIALKSRKTEGMNKWNKWALNLWIISSIISIFFIIILSLLQV
jgi:hypothetical protein